MKKILLVDDDASLLSALSARLSRESYRVETAADGEQGSKLARFNRYDLVILDYLLPKKDGGMILSEMRSSGIATPVLFLSVMVEPQEKADMLDRGADDYMEKPFSSTELSARMRALLRRPCISNDKPLCVGSIALDRVMGKVSVAGKPVFLTKIEYSLLRYLAENQGAVLSRTDIAAHIDCKDNGISSNPVDIHVGHLRRKLGHAGRFIRTVKGRGYTASAIE